MRISEALGERLPLAVQFPSSGSVLNVVYTPAAYTVAELEELQKAERDTSRIIKSVQDVVLEWDLTDDDGQPVPLTTEALRHVPTSIFMQIIRAVNEDQSVGESKA